MTNSSLQCIVFSLSEFHKWRDEDKGRSTRSRIHLLWMLILPLLILLPGNLSCQQPFRAAVGNSKLGLGLVPIRFLSSGQSQLPLHLRLQIWPHISHCTGCSRRSLLLKTHFSKAEVPVLKSSTLEIVLFKEAFESELAVSVIPITVAAYF